jgi:hypothetical protein
MIGVDVWAGEFGDEYTKRNQVEWRKRRPFWTDMMTKTGARSVFEMGANAGWNLSAIREMAPHTTVCGNDINESAARQAQMAGLNVVNILDFTKIPGKFEMVFTAGVLIHIETEHLAEVMKGLIDKSFRFILAVEYPSDEEEKIDYRGAGCWKRPYGELYQGMGLKLVAHGGAGPGFDNCQYWLLEK